MKKQGVIRRTQFCAYERKQEREREYISLCTHAKIFQQSYYKIFASYFIYFQNTVFTFLL